MGRADRAMHGPCHTADQHYGLDKRQESTPGHTGRKIWCRQNHKAFGCMVLTYIPKEKRTSKTTPVSKLHVGIYLGKTEDVRDGMDTEDLEFDFKAQRWVIGGTKRGVVDPKAYPTVFPLRLLPLPTVTGENTQTLERFLESKCLWLNSTRPDIPIRVAVKKVRVCGI